MTQETGALAMVSALREVADAVRESRDPDEGPRGYQGRLEVPWTGLPGLALAMRACRYRDDAGVWHGLAELMRRVPEEFAARACTVGRGPEVWVVSCPCGARELVSDALRECRGGCGRWFIGDPQGAWSVRLPEQDGGES